MRERFGTLINKMSYPRRNYHYVGVHKSDTHTIAELDAMQEATGDIDAKWLRKYPLWTSYKKRASMTGGDVYVYHPNYTYPMKKPVGDVPEVWELRQEVAKLKEELAIQQELFDHYVQAGEAWRHRLRKRVKFT